MPRIARASVGGICYHVINRGNARAVVFQENADYNAFVKLLAGACERVPMRVLAYCLMPNHFHLVLWPKADGELSRFMQWLLTAHVRRHHRVHHSSGHLWQGRFKAFPIQQDEHLLSVLRYVERNALRAKLVRRAENWRWSSLNQHRTGAEPVLLHPGPLARPRDWLAYVNPAQTDDELSAIRQSVNRGTPFGSPAWVKRTVRRLGLEATLRPRGRPRKK